MIGGAARRTATAGTRAPATPTSGAAGEFLFGVKLLPPGRERDEFASWVEAVLGHTFAGPVLSFDKGAARICARLVAQARRTGQSAGLADAQIAAVTLHCGMMIATRDLGDSVPFDIRVVAPSCVGVGRKAAGDGD
jgi:predicted nucleic acid-binding protein